jgi:hypothetical protein
MKLKGILVIALLTISIAGFSQRWKLKRYEAMFGVGSTNIYGDIGGTADVSNLYGLKDIKISETRYSLFVGARYRIQKDLSIRFNMIYGKGVSSDAQSKNDERGYSFKTSIFEPSFQLEYSFLSEERRVAVSKLYNRRGMVNNFSLISAYGFAGVGGVMYSPKLDLHGNTPRLDWETISGYSKFSVAFPIGIGVKYALDKNWSIGFEFGKRFTLTDYMDGISTVFSKANDTYYFGIFNASYKILTNRRGIPEFMARRNRAGLPR